MHAAVVSSFDRPPRYDTIDVPEAEGPDRVVIDVVGAGLHHTVRSRAAGFHYAASDALPMIPGVDGVGRLPDGQGVYFVALDPRRGSMAEQTAVPRGHFLPLPDAADELAVAAGMNPAMSSWLPLRLRVSLQPGQRVVVLGATGSAGRLAVQITKHLGAGHVVGVGRNASRLAELSTLGADAVVQLSGDPADDARAVKEAATDTDVVIDYLWGPPAESALTGILEGRSDPGSPLRWVHVGAITGPTINLPGAALRSHNLMVMGSGQGSMSLAEMRAELPALVELLASKQLSIDAVPVPLREVENIWYDPLAYDKRVVLVPRREAP